MNSKKQKNHKAFGFKRFLRSIKFSVEGLLYAYKNEQSLSLHAFASIVFIILGFIFKISLTNWALLLISLVLVLAIELLNSAVEATVDLVTSKIHPLAKVAKDCGSAAAFVSTINMFIVCGIIFIPYIIDLF